jgi:hypothetical protein
MWQGLLALKNDQAAVQMHFVFGNPHVARESLPCNSDGSTPPLRIAQRMRLEQTQVDGVARKMQVSCGIVNYLICCSKVEHSYAKIMCILPAACDNCKSVDFDDILCCRCSLPN